MRPLEAPFFKHFTEKQCSTHFILDPDMEQNVQEAQQAFLHDLRSCHLVSKMHTQSYFDLPCLVCMHVAHNYCLCFL